MWFLPHLRRRAAFAAAPVDFDARLGHPLQLLDELPRACLKAGVFEHTEHQRTARIATSTMAIAKRTAVVGLAPRQRALLAALDGLSVFRGAELPIWGLHVLYQLGC
jgi:hypothetical protein